MQEYNITYIKENVFHRKVAIIAEIETKIEKRKASHYD